MDETLECRFPCKYQQTMVSHGCLRCKKWDKQTSGIRRELGYGDMDSLGAVSHIKLSQD